ncbi:hypothetical protein GCM10010446_60980 [Streptomyces enissocaesilis]|uniref:Uncharacterized protein n=1 Tax=Streptomyces enissocaesilis TaxID=332589 RepID=A0ABP6K797_9ACTN
MATHPNPTDTALSVPDRLPVVELQPTAPGTHGDREKQGTRVTGTRQ